MSVINSFFLAAACTLTSASLTAQNTFPSSGNVGIGTNSPVSLLHVNGLLTAGNAGGGYHLIINDIPTARWALGSGNYGLHFANDFTGTFTNQVSISKEGWVGIGTEDTKGYSLGVNGPAIFTRAVVKLYGNWPDYVFHPTYSLRPLSEVEQFIRTYQHLPEVPTAEEIGKNNLDLGDNQAMLLKKIEELTLYLIEQNKQLESVKEELGSVKKELQQLKKATGFCSN